MNHAVISMCSDSYRETETRLSDGQESHRNNPFPGGSLPTVEMTEGACCWATTLSQHNSRPTTIIEIQLVSCLQLDSTAVCRLPPSP